MLLLATGQLVENPAHSFLVVDLNADGRLLLERTLARKFAGAQVSSCKTSLEAAKLLNAGSVDLIIAHRAEDMDGPELIKMLRRLDANIPIIMVSGIGREAAAK